MSKALVLPRGIQGQFVALALISALPFAALFGYHLQRDWRATIESAEATARQHAEVMAQGISDQLARIEKLLMSIAQRPLVRAVDAARCDPVLRDLHAVNPHLANLNIIDRNGYVICGAIPPLRPDAINNAEREWFRAAMAGSPFALGIPRVGPITGRWVSAAAVPIRAADGGILGLASAAIDLQSWSPPAATATLPAGTIIGVLDSHGTVVMRSEGASEFVGRNLRESPVFAAMLERREGVVEAPGVVTGVERIWGFRPIGASGWIVYAAIPSEAVRAPLQRRLTAAVLSGLAVLLLTLLIAATLSRRASAPLRAMAEALHANGGGRQDAPIPVSGPRELVELAEAMNQDIAARLRTETAGREMNQRLATRERELSLIMDSVSAVIGRADRETRYLFANRAMAELYQRPAGEMVGRTIREVLGAEIDAQVAPEVARVLAGEEVNFERVHRRSDGSLRRLQVHYLPDRDGSGAVVGWFSVSHDVTAERAAQDALRESEARYRAIFETANEGIWQIDGESRTTLANRRMAEMLGYTIAEMDGRSMFEFMDEQGKAVASANVERRRQGIKEQHDFKFRRKDGSDLWAIVSAAPIVDLAGRYAGAIGMVTDITERKRTDAALRAAEEQFRGLVEQSIAGIYILQDDKLAYVNPHFAEIFGYASIDELIGRESLSLVVEKDRGMVLDARRRVEGGTRSLNYGFTALRKDGSTIEVGVHSARATHRGRPAIIGLMQNISEKKRAEEANRELNETLERRVADRTAALTAANEELERFSYTISHDLRAPLRAMASFAALLKEKLGADPPAGADDYLGRIERNAVRMGALIDDLLAYSRVGRGALSRRETDMGALVAEVVESLAGEQTEGTKIEVAALPGANCDPLLMRQVWLNLIDNALKFSGKAKHPRIEIGGASDNGVLEYWVKDNGMGYNTAHAARLWGVFERLHTAAEAPPGTGIGLAIVKRIIERHGGTLRAESALGKGATFGFTLPLS